MRLTGKVALVTAGARGIGEAIVRRFVAEGARVAICDVLDNAGEALAAALGERARYIRLDAGAKSAWAAAVASTEAAFGPLNILVHDAGTGTSGTSENGIADDFSTSLLVGQASLFWGIQAALPSLRRGGQGSIVGLAPCMGTEARIGLAAYAAIAYGIHGMTRAAAVELGDEGIRANSVRAGLIRRPGINDDQHSGDRFGLIPLHRDAGADRAGQVEDVANAVLFLASDESSYVTGTEFFIDGGLSQCRNSVAGRAYDSGAPAWSAAAARV